MKPQTKILIVEMEPETAGGLSDLLQGTQEEFVLEMAAGIEAAWERLASFDIDLVLIDIAGRCTDAVDVVRDFRSRAPEHPIIVVGDSADETQAMRVVREGAHDCLLRKAIDAATLRRSLRFALERKYTQQALSEVEQRFRQVFEESPLGMALLSSESTLVRVNSSLCAMLGYTGAELTGRSFSSLLAQDGTEARKDWLERLRRSPESRYKREQQLVSKDGSIIWGMVTAAVVRGERKRSDYGILMIEDISERKLAEDALRESHNLLHAVIGGTTDAVYVKDTVGRYLLLNAAASGRLGKRADDVVGETDAAVYPEAVARAIRESDQEILRGGETKTVEEVVDDRTYLSTKGVYRNERGEAVGLFGIARDITRRKQAEEALRRSEAMYRGLVDHALYGIYRSTADGRFVSANPALVKMLGYDSEGELLTLDMARDLYADHDQRARLVDYYRQKQSIRNVEVEWLKKDGEKILVRLSGSPIYGKDGSTEGFEMMVEDITERRKLELQLRQAQKMEAVGELTGGIAHDLNNILTVIAASVDLVAESLPGEHSDLLVDLEQTQTATRRGTALIKKLLGFSARSRLEVRPVSLVQLTSELSGMLRRVVPESIDIRLVADRGHGTVMADQGAVEQMLVNLVTNARDAMPEGGKLEIEVRAVTLGDEYCSTHPWARPGQYVAVMVRDNGTGMDEMTKQRIFEPFFTTKPLGIGTGLGMAMVYGLVKQHEGFIDVESEVGEGTTVTLYFPLEEGEHHLPEVETRPPRRTGAGETVLVVEDEPAIRRAAKRVLERHGYSVLEAEDGEAALKLYRARALDIDLIFSDVVMPKMGGFKFYQALKQEGFAPKVLFTSGYTARDLGSRGEIEAGVPFLNKPWSVAELLEKLRDVLERDV